MVFLPNHAIYFSLYYLSRESWEIAEKVLRETRENSLKICASKIKIECSSSSRQLSMGQTDKDCHSLSSCQSQEIPTVPTLYWDLRPLVFSGQPLPRCEQGDALPRGHHTGQVGGRGHASGPGGEGRGPGHHVPGHARLGRTLQVYRYTGCPEN